MAETIVLSRSLVTRLLHQAQTRPDHEVCGLIGASDDRPSSLYPVANVAKNPRRHFRMDPKGQIEAMKAMRRRGETLFAIYHSHPTAPPFPSQEDLEWVSYPEALTLIISLNIKGVLELRGFRLEGRQPQEVILLMEEM